MKYIMSKRLKKQSRRNKDSMNFDKTFVYKVWFDWLNWFSLKSINDFLPYDYVLRI